jgi:hypothetical protein
MILLLSTESISMIYNFGDPFEDTILCCVKCYISNKSLMRHNTIFH